MTESTKNPTVCTDDEKEYVKKILQCVRCGKCRDICPVLDVLSPGIPTWDIFGSRGRVKLAQGLEEKKIPVNDLLKEALFTCFFCNACVENCPSSVPVTDVIHRARSSIFEQGEAPQVEISMGEEIQESENIFGLDAEDRMMWAFDVEDLIEEKLNTPADVLYFIGCQGTFKGSLAGTPVGMVMMLEQAGVDYTLMGETEMCCGSPYYLMGAEENFREQARKNVDQISALGVKTVLFTCPGCLNTFAKYEKVLGECLPFQLQFATEYLLDCVREGKLSFKLAPEDLGIVTYHDPCELGRHQGIYESPRELLKSIPGLNFREMKDNRENAQCCGGGGLVGAPYPEYRTSQASRKVREFKDNGIDTVVTACYACNDTLVTAAQEYSKENPDDKIRVVDIFDLLGQLIS